MIASHAFYLILAVVAIPFITPVMKIAEAKLFPVVDDINISEIDAMKDGLLVSVKFDKVRDCKFLNVTWYDSLGNRVQIVFDPLDREGYIPYNRLVKDDQEAGPWLLLGLYSLEGSKSITSHDCHPLYNSKTEFFPP
jgi:hypothetical protein